MPKCFEQKYIVAEDTAVALRDYVQGHLQLDEHGEGKENRSYEVHSLYLDSDTLQLYWSCINGDENQLRLRLRYYGDHPDDPVFIETKQLLRDHLVKERLAIRRDAAARLLTQCEPNPDFLISRTRNAILALDRSCKLIQNLNAKPKVHVAFSREAYRTDKASLNFDRFVRAEPALSTELRSATQQPTLIWGNDVVLEMKFIDDQPTLFRKVVQHFGLCGCEVEKYIDPVAFLGERRLTS